MCILSILSCDFYTLNHLSFFFFSQRISCCHRSHLFLGVLFYISFNTKDIFLRCPGSQFNFVSFVYGWACLLVLILIVIYMSVLLSLLPMYL